MCPQLICIIGFGRLEARHALFVFFLLHNLCNASGVPVISQVRYHRFMVESS